MAPPKAPATTERILELLKGEGLAGRQCAETTLEYRGQWQPKPNGAETGHGVVPQDWALDVASENDRQLASYGWAGGAQLCLSNAFGEAQRIEAQAQDLIENGCTEEDPSVQCIRAIARASEEREALMRRQWCDIDFQQGEEANQELLKHLERDFAGQLLHTAQRDLRQETTDEWYHIKRHDPVPGQVYLTASIGGESLELSGHDDASGRHRWQLLPEGQAEGRRTTASWHLIRLLGGTSPGRRLLSRGPSRRLELCDFDDGSGRQRWQVERTGTSTARIKPAHHSGDPGVGAARQVEESARGCFLGSAGSRVVLQEEAVQWKIQGPTGGFAGESFQDGGFSPEAPQAPPQGHDLFSDRLATAGDAGDAMLAQMNKEQASRVLGQNRNLGTAIDLIGAYLKNYEIDKADRLCARIAPLCAERGGLWQFKLLNFYTTVRMKQSRYEEALKMYQEYETLIKFTPEEAWELYDTVYRNFGWIYTSLRDFEKALEYFEKCVSVKRAHGVSPHWFDRWDLGKTHARLALQQGRFDDLRVAAQLIGEALEKHRLAEPEDTIMRCKMLNSAGECYMVHGDFCSTWEASQYSYDKAIALQEESYGLYLQVLGPKKPLTGWAMEDLAQAYQRRGRLEEAKLLVLQAFQVECSKDIIKLSSMARLLDSLLELHQATSDISGLAACQDAINEGLTNLQKRGIPGAEAASYAALLQKIATMLLRHDEGHNRPGAIELLEEGLQWLRRPRESRSEEEAATQDEERHLYMPKAGQQELAVDPAALERSIEDQLQHLRQITLSGPVSETPQAAAAARSSPPTDFEVVDDAVKSPMCFTAVD